MKKRKQEKLLFIISIIIIIFLLILFSLIKINIKENNEINISNINTYNKDEYVYKIENNTLYTKEFSINQNQLNNYELNKTILTNNCKIYIKKLINTKDNINDIKIDLKLINIDELKKIIENNSNLKVYIWLNNSKKCTNIVLYSLDNNIEVVD